MKKAKPILLLLFAAGLLRLLLTPWGYHVDVVNHIAWGNYAVQHGLYGIYDVIFDLPTAWNINQPPGTVLLYASMRLLFNGVAFVIPNVSEELYPDLLKLPGMLCDLGLGYLIYTWAKHNTTEKRALLATFSSRSSLEIHTRRRIPILPRAD